MTQRGNKVRNSKAHLAVHDLSTWSEQYFAHQQKQVRLNNLVKVDPKVKSVFTLLRLIIKIYLPFSTVEEESFGDSLNAQPISRNTLMNYMDKLPGRRN